MPYDADAEAAMVGFLIGTSGWVEAEQVHDDLVPEDFYEVRWQRAFMAWEPGISLPALAAKSGVPSVELNAAQGEGVGLGLAQARSVASLLAALSFRRRAISVGQGLSAAGMEGDEAELHRLIEGTSQLAGPQHAGTPSVDGLTFVEAAEDPYDWVIPGVLEARDRMLITAVEGAGKSVLCAQVAVQVASGVHAWSLKPVEPHKVLYVDLENSERLVRRRLRSIATRVRCDLTNLAVECHPHGIDLTTRAGQVWLAGKVKANRPRLLVIGPLYRMYAGTSAKGDVGGENQARTVVTALDRIREAYGCALLMETHAPHGGVGGRDLRPFGSTVWLRWPEFGLGISQDADNPERYVVKHWRGPRDVRSWPTHLERSKEGWPWTAVGGDGFVWESGQPPKLRSVQ